MLATLVLIAFLDVGGLILAATCNFDYSDSFYHFPDPSNTIRLNCSYFEHNNYVQVCYRTANA